MKKFSFHIKKYNEFWINIAQNEQYSFHTAAVLVCALTKAHSLRNRF